MLIFDIMTEMEFRCDECKKLILIKDETNWHGKRICEHCFFKFKNKNSRKFHDTKHTGKKKYSAWFS